MMERRAGRADAPVSSLHFRVEIDGIPFEGYCHVGELESLIDDSHRAGRRKDVADECEGARSFGSIVLRRAISAHRDLWQWHQAVAGGEDDCRNGSISVLNDAREEAVRIAFCNA